jgi:CubicO group peptidase (beta-lactamase class C family)
VADRFGEVDALAASFQERGGQPGLVYGVVTGGELVHARGLGERWLGGPAPDERTVFRIASMTKSFTAAAVLALRDEGALALGDPAERYVPELRGMALPAPGSPPVTIRHLLTMTAGLPTDDPWGDRQQGLPLASFASFLAGGMSFGWAPGTRFEYSNLGYAILGRVIAAVSGLEYRDFVTQRLLRPLGMTATGFADAEFGAVDLARGYQRGPEGWSALAFDGYGAFAPMGGIFSCVADLARWVAWLAAAFPPGREGAGGHPLAAASRRDMQLPQVMPAAPQFTRLPGDPLAGGLAGYGFGLFVTGHSRYGRICWHSGGYPGFGSHMRWQVATGTGVIVLANSTYAEVTGLAAALLEAVLAPDPSAARPAAALACSPAGPWPATLAAQREAGRLMRSWDEAAAARLLSPNVAADEPLAQRRATIGLIRDRIGPFHDDPGRPAEHDTPAHCRWWLRGERGTVAVEIQLTPEVPPRVQSLQLAVPPAPDGPLARVVTALLGFLNDPAPGWPAGVAVAHGLDTGVLARQFRMAAAWAGRCAAGAVAAGDGQGSVTVELDGEHARLLLAVAVDPVTGRLHQASLALADHA